MHNLSSSLHCAYIHVHLCLPLLGIVRLHLPATQLAHRPAQGHTQLVPARLGSSSRMSKHPPVCMRVRWWAHATTTMHHAASSSYAWRAVAGCGRDRLALLVGMRASSLRQVLSSRALALPAALNKPSRLSHSGRYAAAVGSVVSCEGGLSQSCEGIPVKPVT